MLGCGSGVGRSWRRVYRGDEQQRLLHLMVGVRLVLQSEGLGGRREARRNGTAVHAVAASGLRHRVFVVMPINCLFRSRDDAVLPRRGHRGRHREHIEDRHDGREQPEDSAQAEVQDHWALPTFHHQQSRGNIVPPASPYEAGYPQGWTSEENHAPLSTGTDPISWKTTLIFSPGELSRSSSLAMCRSQIAFTMLRPRPEPIVVLLFSRR